jgi:hypothetical protein
MTRDQIIAKWNGLTRRERDAWVAEVVFGYTVWYEKHIGGDIFIKPNGVRMTVPRYTEDIAAAWTVVKKSAEWGGMDIGCYGKPGAQFYVAATYTDTAPYQRTISVTRDNASEAISLTAIIAKLSSSV